MQVLDGKTMLVVGLGGIGTEVASRAHALGMKVIATRNSGRTGPDYVSYVGLPSELLTLAKTADVIVNTAPLTTETTGIFNAKFFADAEAERVLHQRGARRQRRHRRPGGGAQRRAASPAPGWMWSIRSRCRRSSAVESAEPHHLAARLLGLRPARRAALDPRPRAAAPLRRGEKMLSVVDLKREY